MRNLSMDGASYSRHNVVFKLLNVILQQTATSPRKGRMSRESKGEVGFEMAPSLDDVQSKGSSRIWI